jgi:hypothetical protein
VRTDYVVVQPGQPCRILDKAVVNVKTLTGDSAAVKQDVTGWVCMPPTHWEVVADILAKYRASTTPPTVTPAVTTPK